jgi:hypothetical protein
MCAMGGKPRCSAVRSAIHTVGQTELFHAAGSLSDIVTMAQRGGRTL